MAGRMESEKKKTAFIEACENLDPLKAIPEKILQAQKLADSLKQEEIDTTMLYKCGCPQDWLPNTSRKCKLKRNEKPKPKYSNECTACWVENLTEEVTIDKNKEYDFKDIQKEYQEYKKIGLSPIELKEILTYLGWYEIEDYGLLIDTIKDMREHYERG